MRETWRRMAPFIWACSVFWVGAGFWWSSLAKGQDLAFFNPWKGTALDELFIYGTLLGEAYAYVVAFLALLVWQRRDAIWIGWTALAVAVVSQATKFGFRQPRPGAHSHESWFSDGVTLVEGVRPLTGSSSFPSGHTMAAFALAAILVYLLPSRSRWWLPLFLLAILVGCSRVYLVMHFLEDVLAGSLMGVVVAFTVAVIHQRYSAPAPASSESIN